MGEYCKNNHPFGICKEKGQQLSQVYLMRAPEVAAWATFFVSFRRLLLFGAHFRAISCRERATDASRERQAPLLCPRGFRQHKFFQINRLIIKNNHYICSVGPPGPADILMKVYAFSLIGNLENFTTRGQQALIIRYWYFGLLRRYPYGCGVLFIRVRAFPEPPIR